jgi:hypothetical protein
VKYEDEVAGWRRQWAVETSMAINKGAKLKRIMKDALQLDAYVNGRAPVDIKQLNQPTEKEKPNEQKNH